LRVGIGRPPDGVEAETFVLERFTPDERAVMDGAIERAANAALAVVSDGLESAMNRVNVREAGGAHEAIPERRAPGGSGPARG
jgi:PTH1 family peptidyl-tRNA hydrolase